MSSLHIPPAPTGPSTKTIQRAARKRVAKRAAKEDKAAKEIDNAIKAVEGQSPDHNFPIRSEKGGFSPPFETDLYYYCYHGSAAHDANPSRGRGKTEQDRISDASERERLRRYHDRNLLEDTARRDTAWVKAGNGVCWLFFVFLWGVFYFMQIDKHNTPRKQGISHRFAKNYQYGQTRQRTIRRQRMKQIRSLFGNIDWPKSDAGWERYDRERNLALQEIHDARVLRGFGEFDLIAYVQGSAGPNDDKEIKASSGSGDAATKVVKASSIGEHTRVYPSLCLGAKN